MEFYKLFKRRTNWEELYHWQRRLIKPEEYERAEQKCAEAMRKLALTAAMLHSITDRISY